MKLSDSFPEGADADIEVKVRMLNINYGRNQKLLDMCRPLMEYSWFVAEVRKNSKGMEIEHAVDLAVSEMPGDYILKPFLEIHKAEVKGMMLTEYDEAETMNMFKEEGRKEGMQRGIQQGILSTLVALVNEHLISIGDAAHQAGMSEEAFRKKLDSDSRK